MKTAVPGQRRNLAGSSICGGLAPFRPNCRTAITTSATVCRNGVTHYTPRWTMPPLQRHCYYTLNKSHIPFGRQCLTEGPTGTNLTVRFSCLNQREWVDPLDGHWMDMVVAVAHNIKQVRKHGFQSFSIPVCGNSGSSLFHKLARHPDC